MGDLTTKIYRVLCIGEEVAWEVGEHEDTAELRRRGLAPSHDSAVRYLDDFPGRIISIVPFDQRFSPADLKNPCRRELLIQFTESELADARSGKYKIPPGLNTLADVTFEDKYGATSSNLLTAFPGATVTAEEDERGAIDAVHTANSVLELTYEAELAEWKESYTEAFLAGEPLEPKPARPILQVPPDPVFGLEVVRQKKKLAKTVVHTGAGLYKVDSSGTPHNDTIDKIYRNLLQYSEEYGVWIPANVSVASNVATDPEGGETADKVIENATLNYHYIDKTTTDAVDGVSQYAFSTDAKKGERDRITLELSGGGFSPGPKVVYDLDGGQVESAQNVDASGITSLGDGWYRCWFLATSTSASTTTFFVELEDGEVYQGDGVSGVYLWRSAAYKSTILLYPPRSVGTVRDYYITLVTGGMTPGDRAGELFVASGSYSVFANGTDWVGVRGDPSGESGSCSISPYTTIQSALDQLWADQGSSAFTLIQYIRVFSGTYSESVVPNASLNPDEAAGFLLVIEGDPAEDRANIVVNGSGGIGVFYVNCDQCLIRHMTANIVSSTNYTIWASTGCWWLSIKDCALLGRSGSNNMVVATFSYSLSCVNCTITSPGGQGIRLGGDTGPVYLSGCEIIQTSSQYGTGLEGLNAAGAVIESTTFSGWVDGVRRLSFWSQSLPQIKNCNFYNCGTGVEMEQSAVKIPSFINNIFKDNTVALEFSCWPDEANGTFAGPVTLRNNCFHGNTNVAYNGSTYKTLTQLAALDQVDAADDIENDPLFTNPGAGDFSLDADSPCRHAGHGSGVITGVNGVPFDKYHPDIGAWSSGLNGDDGGGLHTLYLLEEA